MNQNEDQVKDPVCEMMVDPQDNAIEYQQMSFAFCSKQCQERFLANPHLYIGIPGIKAPKQEGREVIKRRRMHLSHTLSPDEIALVSKALQAMMGIKDLAITQDTIEITYDLLQATLKQIEGKLVEIGIQLGGGWAERLQRAFLQESEELQVESMEVTTTPHYPA